MSDGEYCTDAETAAPVQAAVELCFHRSRLYFDGDALASVEGYKQAKEEMHGFSLCHGQISELFFSNFSLGVARGLLTREYHSLRKGWLESSNEFMQHAARTLRSSETVDMIMDRPERSDKRLRSGDQISVLIAADIGTGTLVLDATIGTGVSSPTELPTLVPSKTRHRPEGYTYPVCTHIAIARRNTGASSWVMLTRSRRIRPRLCAESGTRLLSYGTITDVPSIHDQPIVSEFQDVFPEELPGIPTIRDVEFNIELIPKGAEAHSPRILIAWSIELKEFEGISCKSLLERENWTDYNDEAEPIPFRRRVFSSSLDGQPIRGKHVEALINSQAFKKLDDNDAVSLCCVGILRLVLLGLEDRRPVPNWILRLVNDRDGWDNYPWGSHGQLPVEGLVPDEIEARSRWWVSSRAYFDGRNIEDERIPRHLNRNNYFEVPS
ncbi:hypothetical protein Tco_0683475 [Tanacetum coccineum]|uniref:DUF1985 domain-containing protein n=1 Tax=Tanacetum coccineum TaxID=301880 RepID=A0ABQ4XU21_9ASTR